MGYIALHSEIPEEVQNFFSRVKAEFHPKNEFHSDDWMQKD